MKFNIKNKLSDTYPISIGLKASNRNLIEEIFVQECIELSNGINNVFYYMQERRNVVVHFDIVTSLGDQPERRSMNYLMLGNSTFSLRYGYASNVGAIWQYLLLCSICHNAMENNPLFFDLYPSTKYFENNNNFFKNHTNVIE